MPEQSFDTTVTVAGGSTVVQVSGEIDHFNASDFADVLRGAVEQGDGILIIDLGDVGFLDLGGLAAIEEVATTLTAGGRRARLRHPSRPVTLLLDLRRRWTLTDPWDTEW